MDKEINIVDWFDPDFIDHIRAYKYFKENKNWPKGFIPKNMVYPILWKTDIDAKMAERWIEYMEQEEKLEK